MVGKRKSIVVWEKSYFIAPGENECEDANCDLCLIEKRLEEEE